jgi:hypothetical protein
MEVGGQSGWGRRNDGWTCGPCGGTFVHVKGAERDPSDFFAASGRQSWSITERKITWTTRNPHHPASTT